MDSAELEDLFHDFLITSGALKSYIDNTKARNSEVPEALQALPPEKWISGAFLWSNTPEKDIYWGRLSDEWEDIVDDNR